VKALRRSAFDWPAGRSKGAPQLVLSAGGRRIDTQATGIGGGPRLRQSARLPRRASVSARSPEDARLGTSSDVMPPAGRPLQHPRGQYRASGHRNVANALAARRGCRWLPIKLALAFGARSGFSACGAIGPRERRAECRCDSVAAWGGPSGGVIRSSVRCLSSRVGVPGRCASSFLSMAGARARIVGAVISTPAASRFIAARVTQQSVHRDPAWTRSAAHACLTRSS
jgi:hypothetical protein